MLIIKCLLQMLVLVVILLPNIFLTSHFHAFTGSAQRELSRNGVTCISDTESNICITSDTVRLTTGKSPTVLYLTGDQQLSQQNQNTLLQVRPYARKTDTFAMARTSPVTIISNAQHPPPCDINHSVPAVIFSNGGFAGNFFHDVNDVIIPLFLTSSHLRSRVQFVITDYEQYWVNKYRKILTHLSSFDIIVASSSSSTADKRVHCFPAAVVGLKYHGNFLCNSTSEPGGVSTADFRHFLHTAFSLRKGPMGPTNSPTMVLLSRRKSRKILNEENVAELAREVGFRVIVATQEVVKNLQNFTELVNGCNILMGVHGAGLTNLMFLRQQAVVLQVVPWGLDWASMAYYARPAKRLGLQYIEYLIEVEESSLYNEYPKDHPVLTDPWGINLKGYNVSKPVYTDGQNVKINLARFKDTLLKARELVRNSSKVSVE